MQVILSSIVAGYTWDDKPIFRVSTYRCGLGDALFATGALDEFGRRAGYPCFAIHTWAYPEIFDNQPWLYSITVDTWGERTTLAHLDLLLGPEKLDETPTRCTSVYTLLGIDDTPYSERRLSVRVMDFEREEAVKLLASIGWLGQPILGVQARGGAEHKAWSGMSLFVKQAVREGYFVVWTNWNKAWSENIGKSAWLASTRITSAIQCLCTCWVGFDSGPAYMAVAVGCPVVFLSGPVSALNILSGMGGHTNFREIRRDWRQSCLDKFGWTCRQPWGMAWVHSNCIVPAGKHNPHTIGSGCIDDITVDEVWLSLHSAIQGRKEELDAIQI